MTQTPEAVDVAMVLSELADVLDARRQASPQTSYVAQLLQSGEDKILKKVIEEAGEVLMASKDGDRQHLVKEVADVWFHTMVLLTYHQIRVEDVLQELQQRQHISGLTEKASRQPQ
ncbi:phosphoribosyl-ATP diphosphatase [Snodgrassella alvi]|uniref:Phosphoribosyl-ATP pyrophosphatase n=2 Tax=Neisseriaceae TaxID=481 RepID=A0A2N9WVX1_9NEIS|nr:MULTISPECIES: phosphoribosyl-ATP diphosphatase [Snodgrassella]NUE66493.1 phosphoribosyl-ATP diphosphatase [Snodgrassella sp. ESL0253]PIT14151.1 phosphoribosyl-ATP diphosphatase [Snodgrassella alvi]PIT16033.1 phosphoribosyl-ATP diphosphatase [Snodgrassella alvi]PIT17581.1 phosphoribosyl-ATP diphosphatase [Snodgrassella alvi]